MNDAAVLEMPRQVNLPKIDANKKKVLDALKSKAEQAKLNLIYTELEEENISFEKNYSSVNELEHDLKNKLSKLDYGKVCLITEKINSQIDLTVKELSNGSTNAFTKLMTSDLTKTIAKTLGISLAGRTALLLAPTITAKAIVGAGLAGYGIYKMIKNRKEIKATNENNELNNILSELETTIEETPEGKKITTDTRLNEEMQSVVRRFLDEKRIDFSDTGYRSLRQAMYSLDTSKKRELVDLLNIRMARGIRVEERVNKAKKKLNVVASSFTTAGLGLKFGIDAANAINGIDPGLLAGVINGTFLGTWLGNVSQKEWVGTLTGAVGAVGTEVLERLPVVGKTAHSVFAAENLASLASIGATGGLVVGAALGVASGVKQIVNYAKDKKENEEFIKLDAEKYRKEDNEEFIKIQAALKEPKNAAEAVTIDIILGYMKDNGIVFDKTPKTVFELKQIVENIKDPNEKREVNNLLSNVTNSFSDDNFKNQLLKAGTISVDLFLAGFAALSVYDIIKGGTFLPELSQKIFPENNIYTPVSIPAKQDVSLDPVNEQGPRRTAESLENEFVRGNDYSDEFVGPPAPSEYLNENTLANQHNNAIAEFKADVEVPKEGNSLAHLLKLYSESNRALTSTPGPIENALEPTIKNISEALGNDIVQDMIPNETAIMNKLNTLGPDELLFFMRYMKDNPGTDIMTSTIKRLLGYTEYTNKVVNYISHFETIQNNNNLVNNLSDIVSKCAIPTSVFAESLALAQKQSTNKDFNIKDSEIKSVSVKTDNSSIAKSLDL